MRCSMTSSTALLGCFVSVANFCAKAARINQCKDYMQKWRLKTTFTAKICYSLLLPVFTPRLSPDSIGDTTIRLKYVPIF